MSLQGHVARRPHLALLVSCCSTFLGKPRCVERYEGVVTSEAVRYVRRWGPQTERSGVGRDRTRPASDVRSWRPSSTPRPGCSVRRRRVASGRGGRSRICVRTPRRRPGSLCTPPPFSPSRARPNGRSKPAGPRGALRQALSARSGRPTPRRWRRQPQKRGHRGNCSTSSSATSPLVVRWRTLIHEGALRNGFEPPSMDPVPLGLPTAAGPETGCSTRRARVAVGSVPWGSQRDRLRALGRWGDIVEAGADVRTGCRRTNRAGTVRHNGAPPRTASPPRCE